MLEQQRRISPESVQAAHGRFFDGSTITSAENLYELSHEFYGLHEELFNGQVGLVLQAGVSDAGEYINLNDTKDHARSVVRSVFFDAERARNGVYDWQITEANLGAGREVYRLHAKPGQTTALCGSFDQRGTLYDKNASADVLDAALNTLSEALGCGLVKDRVTELYTQKQQAQAALRCFAVDAVLKHNPKRHQQKMAQAEESIKRISFPVLGLTDL